MILIYVKLLEFYEVLIDKDKDIFFEEYDVVF